VTPDDGSTDTPGLTRVVEGSIVELTMNRPERLNALDRNLQSALRRAIEEFDADDALRVAILLGAGRAFSSGGDLKEMAVNTRQSGAAFEARSIGEMLPALVERIRKPVIAAIDGPCVAGGLELALACDIRVATRASIFGLPEVTRAMLAGPGLVSLRRSIPVGEAMHLHLTGRPIDADRAYALGLIQAVSDDRATMLGVARDLAETIALHDPGIVSEIRRIVRAPDRDAAHRLSGVIDKGNAAIAQSSNVARALDEFTHRSERTQ
jgi:enoyl-CoA hydratase